MDTYLGVLSPLAPTRSRLWVSFEGPAVVRIREESRCPSRVPEKTAKRRPHTAPGASFAARARTDADDAGTSLQLRRASVNVRRPSGIIAVTVGLPRSPANTTPKGHDTKRAPSDAQWRAYNNNPTITEGRDCGGGDAVDGSTAAAASASSRPLGAVGHWVDRRDDRNRARRGGVFFSGLRSRLPQVVDACRRRLRSRAVTTTVESPARPTQLKTLRAASGRDCDPAPGRFRLEARPPVAVDATFSALSGPATVYQVAPTRSRDNITRDDRIGAGAFESEIPSSRRPSIASISLRVRHIPVA